MRSLSLPASPIEESGVARVFVWGALAVAATAIVLYGQDYFVPPICLVVAAAGHRASHRRRHLPRGAWRQAVIAGLVFCCLAYFLLDSVGAIFGGQLPQANFALLLAAVTSFDLKTRRNLYSSLFISLAGLYLAAVYAWDYPFGLLIGAWALCLAGFWTGSHLRRMGAGFSFPLRPVAIAALAGLVAGLGAFGLLPQPSTNPPGPLIVGLPSGLTFKGELENPALPLVQFSGDTSGANSSVDLRYRGRLGQDVVMYVRAGAPGYWRGLVFDHYENGIWYTSRQDVVQYPPYVDSRRLPAPIGPQLGTFVQVFRVVRPLPGVIYGAAPIQSIYYPAAEIRRNSYGAWLAPGPLKPGQTYSVVSSLPDYRPIALQSVSGEDQGGEYRDFSRLSARAAALARSVVPDPATASRYESVMALTKYLQDHYRYSLQLGHVPPNTDPVDWFLFDAKIGYCEQFATAETLMLRSLGIPARLATGYSTGDYDPVLDQAVVRARDAHAWVEVFFPGHGWVPVDPSPGFPSLAATKFPDRWAAAGLAHLIPHLSIGAPGSLLGSLGALALIPGLIAVAAVVVAAGLWLFSRTGRPRWQPEPAESELLRIYDRLQRRARRRRAPPETPREYSAAVAGSELDPVLREVTDAVNEGVYAGRWPEPARLAGWRKRISQGPG